MTDFCSEELGRVYEWDERKGKVGTKVVIDKGIAGLGNRLRCVTATIEYAKKTGRKVYIDWTDGMFAAVGVNAFNKYFRLVDVPYIDSFENVKCQTFYPSVYAQIPMSGSIYDYFEKKQIENRFARKGMHYLFRGLHKLGEKNPDMDKMVAQMSQFYQSFVLLPEYQKKFGETGRFAFGAHLNTNIEADAVIYCDNIPFYSADVMRKHIALQPWVEEKVGTFVGGHELDRDSVSVHIRASGKRCYGDMQKFVGKLKVFCREKEIKRVFLCTDNNEAEQLFKKEIGLMLVTQDKYIPEIRAGETGIHDFAQNSGDEALKERLTLEAVIDMFAMTRTKYLFYQFGSTFSEISKVYQQYDPNAKSWMNI